MRARLFSGMGWTISIGSAVAMLTGIVTTEIGVAIGAIGVLAIAHLAQRKTSDKGRSA